VRVHVCVRMRVCVCVRVCVRARVRVYFAGLTDCQSTGWTNCHIHRI